MENESKITISGNFMGLLLIAFIVLKLAKVISWSWWWVLSPLWIPVAGLILLGILYVIVSFFEKRL